MIVGIARDVKGLQFGKVKQPTVYVPIDAESSQTSFAVRVHGDPERTRVAILDRFASIDPAVGEVATLRTIAATVAYLLQIAFWLTVSLGALALVLTLSGLFSVLSYGRAAHQGDRRSDCARRDGAEHRDARGCADGRPWASGCLLGVSLTVRTQYPASGTLDSGAIGSIVRLFDPVAYLASLLGIVAACACAALIPTLRAGRIDPIAALRHD